ncbi:MAG TPA: tetratricopeptide repeat protein [Spirochaetota bacterium]|nr:tetratricopeptide repeat protein [Spirochaetota bacterium]HPV42757.1 tetratricopeptide repeat protein [Spirochaetota bacterium]
MKHVILIAMLCAVPAAGMDMAGGYLLAKDIAQTEDIINTILKDDSGTKPDDAKKSDTAVPADAVKKDKAAPQPPDEKKTAPDAVLRKEKKGTAAREETAPRITNEEQVLLKTGIDFFNNGLYDHSLKKFQDLSAKFPQGTYKDSARFWMGKIYLKQYKYDDAIREFSSVTAESGDYPASLYYAGESMLMKGNQIASIEYYQRVQAQFPSHELADKALLNIARLYLNQQKGTQALDSAVKIIKFYKDRDTVDDAYYMMGKVYEKDPKLKDIETARKIYRQFIKKGETDPRFGRSPLRKRVQEDLQRVDRMYFKLEQ